MKTLGIIGGIGPEATIDYYRRLLAGYRERRRDGPAPSILINSIDPRIVQRLAADDRETAIVGFVAALDRLARAGADVALIAACTPHVLFDELQRRSSLPLINVMEATCEAARAAGLRRLGLFGTRVTMRAEAFRALFASHGLAAIAPDATEQTFIHRKYLTELLPGRLLPETRAALVRIALAMRARDGIEALVLGGTELPLLLSDPSYEGLPMLDTTAIHVRAAIDALLG